MSNDPWRIDSQKIIFHPQRVAQWQRAKRWHEASHVMPIYWEITTQAACNHRCVFCSTDAIGYPNEAIDTDVITARMAEAARLGVKSVMLAGTGEPLLHKDIDHIILKAKTSGLDVGITTNGLALHKVKNVDLCTWIKVSLNAGTRESYAAIHQTKTVDWDRVWSNIADARARKGTCTIGVQCVVLPDNVMDMPALVKRCQEVKVDYLVLKPYSQATFMLGTKYKDIRYKLMSEQLENVAKLSTPEMPVIYRRNAFDQEGESIHYDRCLATPMFWTYTMADGRMFACSAHLLDERFCIGNINTDSFQDIWEGEGRRKLYELMKSFDVKQCRLNCRMDRVNRYLHAFDQQEHINFP